MKSLYLKIGVFTICMTMAAIAVFSIITHNAYAQVGVNIKDSISCLDTEEWTEEQKAKFDAEMKKKSFIFEAPDAFTADIKSSIITSKDAVKKELFVTEINPYDTSVQWKSMSVDERVRISEIPKEKLNELTTDDLILLSMNYNFFSDIFVADSIIEGFDRISSQFNGLYSLLKKKDNGARLVKLYQTIDLSDLYEKDRFSTLRYSYLEMILAEQSFLKNLDESEARELILECYNKGMEIIENHSGKYTIATTLYLGLRCLYEHDSEARQIIDGSKAIREFVDTGRLELNEVSDYDLGELALHFQKNYFGGE